MREALLKLPERLDGQPRFSYEFQHFSFRRPHPERLVDDAIGHAVGNHQDTVHVAVKQIAGLHRQARRASPGR